MKFIINSPCDTSVRPPDALLPPHLKKKNLSSVNEVLPWFTWTKWYKVDKELDWPSCMGHMWWPVAFYPFIVCPTVVSPLTWQGVIIKNKVNWITLIMLISLKFKSLKVLFQIPSFLCGDELHVIWLILLNLRYAVKTEGKKTLSQLLNIYSIRSRSNRTCLDPQSSVWWPDSVPGWRFWPRVFTRPECFSSLLLKKQVSVSMRNRGAYLS